MTKNRDAFKSGGKKHYASKDRDHDNHGKFNNRHRVFRNGAWIWVYGTGYTAYGNDCYWLRRQASHHWQPILVESLQPVRRLRLLLSPNRL